jgi:hypothetical protein
MGETTTDAAITKTKALGVTCAKGHQIYLMYFTELDQYGFGCGTCKTFGLEVDNRGRILTVTFQERPQPKPEPFRPEFNPTKIHAD